MVTFKENFEAKFKVGDKITLSYWRDDEYVEIIAIGKKVFFAVNQLGDEDMKNFSHEWKHYYMQTPIVKACLWEIVYKDSNGQIFIGRPQYALTHTALIKEYEKFFILKVTNIYPEFYRIVKNEKIDTNTN
ncbi:MAG: hypothetical protein HGB12_12620 [Bacteroidetes bacterium]|nr:hypothetical protein [Bacteroidota bacterium]